MPTASRPPKGWDYRCELPHPALFGFYKLIVFILFDLKCHTGCAIPLFLSCTPSLFCHFYFESSLPKLSRLGLKLLNLQASGFTGSLQAWLLSSVFDVTLEITIIVTTPGLDSVAKSQLCPTGSVNPVKSLNSKQFLPSHEEDSHCASVVCACSSSRSWMIRVHDHHPGLQRP